MKVYSRSRRMKEMLEWFILKFEPSCFFCKKSIDNKVFFQSSDGLTIHHKNHNRGDNSPSNLVISHRTCHKSYHAKQVFGKC